MKAKDIIKILEDSFPSSNAEDWDNVGLLVGDLNKEVKKIQFSIDATLKAIDKAIADGVDMIITHHPVIFKAIKSLREQDILGKKLRKLIKNDINVYCIHTNLDSTLGGLNDYVLEKLGLNKSKILDFNLENNCGIGRIYSLEKEIDLRKYIQEIKEKLEIKNLRAVSRNYDTKISKIALINGSAMSYWRDAKSKNIDLFITGDIGYHDALDAMEAGLNIVDFGHYESENFFYEVVKKKLEAADIEFTIYNDGPIFNFF